MMGWGFSRYALCSCVAVALLVGCGSQPPIGAPGVLAQSHTAASPADRSGSWMLPEAKGEDLIHAARGCGEACVLPYPQDAQARKAFLYLGNNRGSASTFNVYSINDSKLLRRIPRSWGVYAMAIDPWGDVYTADGFPSGGKIVAYTPGGRSTLLQIYDDAVNAVAFDSSGDLYEDDEIFIREYAPRSTKLLRSFGLDAYNVSALAVDNSGNLYAAQLSKTSSGTGMGLIKVYAPGVDKPFRKITHGITTPVALLFDAAGNLYVANCPICYYRNRQASVAEYAPKSGTPSRVLKKDIVAPVALALSPNGLLFVANDPLVKQQSGWVSIFRSSGSEPIRKIAKGAKGPNSLAIAPDGDLYVSNLPVLQSKGTRESVSVYSSDEEHLIQTIVKGVAAPSAVAIGY